MDQFNFWQKWLFVYGLSLIGFGFVLSFFSPSVLMNSVFNNQIDPVFWGTVDLTDNALRFRTWIYGVLGAVISGWGVFLTFLAYYPFRKKEPWVWGCIGAGFSVWFIIDSVISAHYHVGFNLIVNAALFLLVALPLFFTRKHFHTRS